MLFIMRRENVWALYAANADADTSVVIQNIDSTWQLKVNERLSEDHKNICIDISAAPRKIGAKFLISFNDSDSC